MPPDRGYLAPSSAKVRAPQKLEMPPNIHGNKAHHTFGSTFIVAAGVTNMPDPILDPMAMLQSPYSVNFFSSCNAIERNIFTTLRNFIVKSKTNLLFTIQLQIEAYFLLLFQWYFDNVRFSFEGQFCINQPRIIILKHTVSKAILMCKIG